MSAFVDTNIAGYLLADGSKQIIAKRIIEARPVISVQVLNEFFAVCRKSKHDPDTAYAMVDTLASACAVESLTVETYRKAKRIALRYGFSHWDSLIVASAILAGCTILYTEDLQHRQKIEGLTVRNPFVSQSRKPV
jgi:predicted nucleic acid-binding protein